MEGGVDEDDDEEGLFKRLSVRDTPGNRSSVRGIRGEGWRIGRQVETPVEVG